MDLRKCTCMYISDILKISEPGRSLIYELSIPIRQEMENSEFWEVGFHFLLELYQI